MEVEDSEFVDDSFDLKFGLGEVKQEAKRKVACFQVIQALSEMGIIEFLNSFQLRNDEAFYQ